MKKLTIEWRHLDVDGETCARCYDTGETIAAELRRLNRALNQKGIEVAAVETKLGKDQVAQSNEVLFNGIPIEKLIDLTVSYTVCESCSDLLCEEGTECRAVRFEGEEYDDIPAKAIRRAAYAALGLSEKQESASGCGCGCGCGTGCC